MESRKERAKYNILFKGDLLEGRKLEAVKKNLGKLLKLNPDTVETLFSSKTLIIRKNVDIKTADKYRRLFRKAGAVCMIRAIAPEGKRQN